MRFIPEHSDYVVAELRHEDWIAPNAFSHLPETGLSVVDAGSVEAAPEIRHPDYELIHCLNVDDWYTPAAMTTEHEDGFTVVDAGSRLNEVPSFRNIPTRAMPVAAA
jgi:hypothetical protein